MGINPKILLTDGEAAVFRSAVCRHGLCLCCFTPERLKEGFARREFGFNPEEAAILTSGLSAVDYVQLRRYLMGGDEDDNAPIERIRFGSIRYRRSDPDEHWQTWRDIRNQGFKAGADCEDLAALYAADLRVKGWDTKARPVVYRAGPALYHVVVWSPGYGTFFDPSRMAGMGKE